MVVTDLLIRLNRLWYAVTPFKRGRYFGLQLSRWGVATKGWSAPDLRTDGGLKLVYDPAIGMDHIVRRIALLRAYEPATADLFRELLPHGGTFMDVGANLGYFSITAAGYVGEKGRVMALEPVPHIFELLRRNLDVNQVHNVTALPFGCAATSGTMQMVLHADSGSSHLAPQQGSGGVEVQVSTVDEVVSEYGIQRLDLLKIDVEGAELEVLKGANETIRDFRPAAFLEVNHLERFGASESAVRDYLSPFGYSFMRITNGASTDLLCMPAGRDAPRVPHEPRD